LLNIVTVYVKLCKANSWINVEIFFDILNVQKD